MDRRTFLRLGMGGTALVVAKPFFRRDPALAQPAPGTFGYGVASGDPLPDRVMLWTRVTPTAEATPGSGEGPAVEVAWEVATDAAFDSVVAHGAVTTDATLDHTVKVDAAGLPPGRELWYRFRALDETSPVGRTRTAPAVGADVASLRIGVASCSHYEVGYFSAYRHLAARDDLDLILHLGDYLYEGAGSSDGLTDRRHDPDHEMVALADYRRRHALYKSDPDLRALHQRYAFVTTIDDHEVTDNAWSDGAGNHQVDEGDYLVRRAAAMRAYFEWMPLRPSGGAAEPHRIWRRSAFGGLADLFVLDERTYRSKQVEGIREDMFVTSPEVEDPSRTMLGSEQRAWLEDGLATSDAQWKILANSVMFTPFLIADMPDDPVLAGLLSQVFTAIGAGPPLILNGDQWDGYRAEQAALSAQYGAAGGVVILTGDIHSSWAAEVPADAATYLPGVGGPTTAVEFVTPSVTSTSLGTTLARILSDPIGPLVATQLPLLVTTVDSWIKYLDAERQGFGVFEVTAQHAHYDWFHVVDRTDPESGIVDGPSWRSPAGTNKLEPAGRLGPRAEPEAPPAAVPVAPAVPPAPVEEAAPVAASPSGRLPATGRGVPLALAAGATAAGVAAATAARAARPEPPTVEAEP